jgi:hypothetical protein
MQQGGGGSRKFASALPENGPPGLQRAIGTGIVVLLLA